MTNELRNRTMTLNTLNIRKAIFIACAVLVFTLAVSPFAVADETMPGEKQRTPIALINGTVHTMTGKPIEGATLLFVDGKIAAVGKTVRLPAKTRKIDIRGKHVFPGMFEAHSQLGITEIGSVRPTWDFAESGEFNPNVKANVSVNPDNFILPVTRANGVLLALSAPTSGVISGQSSVIQLDGWTYEDMTLSGSAAMQMSWPSTTLSPRFLRFFDKERIEEIKKERQKEYEEMVEFFETARQYQAARAAESVDQPFDARLEAMIPVLQKKIPLMIRANKLADIESSVAFVLENDLKMILLGGYDADRCAKLLKENNIPVIIPAVYRLPSRRHAAFDAPYTLPARLQKLGVQYCISGTDRSETWNARILPYHAGTAVAYGLDQEEAMRAITRYPAEILGVGDQVGTLEKGKHATLIVTDGSPLEATTQVLSAYVQGRQLDLSSRHTRLYEKYKKKYEK